MKSWENMDSFEKVLFLALAGLWVGIPSTLVTSIVIIVLLFFYCIFAPYISGQSLDFFTPILIVTTALFLIYFNKTNKKKSLGWELLSGIYQSARRWSLALLIILIMAVLITIIFGASQGCIIV